MQYFSIQQFWGQVMLLEIRVRYTFMYSTIAQYQVEY